MRLEYGSISNVLDCPTVVIPVTKASCQLDIADINYRPLNDVDKRNWMACTQINHKFLTGCWYLHIDDPEAYDGAPASLQIFCRRFEEEKLLSIAQLVVDALEKYMNGNENV